MIKSVRIVNHLNESITLELARPEKSGFAILSIEGLGPSKATINSTEVSTMDGAIFNSSRVVARNIVFDLRFCSNPRSNMFVNYHTSTSRLNGQSE